MSWLKLGSPIGTNYRVETGDLMNTKRALAQLGYYNVPPHRGIDDWTDDHMFDGIRRFQKDNGLKVDAFMRPGGPTETAINGHLQRLSYGAPLFAGDQNGAEGGPLGYSSFDKPPCAQPPYCGQNPCVKTRRPSWTREA